MREMKVHAIYPSYQTTTMVFMMILKYKIISLKRKIKYFLPFGIFFCDIFIVVR